MYELSLESNGRVWGGEGNKPEVQRYMEEWNSLGRDKKRYRELGRIEECSRGADVHGGQETL